MKFSCNDLPCLGVTWTYFPTQKEAIAFARWAEKETARDEYPCEAFVDYRPDEERWEVKVRNW